MADEETNAPEEQENPQKSKKKLIIIVLLLVIIGGGAGIYFSGMLSKPSSNEKKVESTEEEPKKEELAGQIVFYDMKEFIANLNVGSKRPSFLKMSVSLELPNELQVAPVEKNMPKIRDSFQIYLRELKREDLEGSAGIYRLREELLLRINKIVYPAKINDILFKEILVQ